MEKKKVKAIILAGGFGTRLAPVLEPGMPKCLAPVMGRPMVDLIIRNLRKQGIKDITLALHYQADKFIEKFGETLKYKIEDEPLGTGGAVKNCIENRSPVLVMNGDTITDIDYLDMLLHHVAPITVARTPDGISAGICIINPDVLDNYHGKFSLENDVIPNVQNCTYDIPWFTDYGTPESYNNAPHGWD